MSTDYKTWLGVIAVVIGFLSYIPYFRDILQSKTKPHAFSWLVWSILNSIAFSAQITKGAGVGAWVTAGTAIICLTVFIFSIFRGEKNISKTDIFSLLGAGVGLLLWTVTKDPISAVILVTIIDALGFIPTFRKSFYKPHEETLSTFTVSIVKYTLSLFALRAYNITTWLLPASLVLTDGLFVVMLVVRRKVLANKVVHGNYL